MAYRDPGGAKCAETQTASTTGVMALSVCFQASCSRHSEGLFGWSFSIAPPIQALRGLPCLGFFSVFPRVRHVEGPLLTEVLLCSSTHQALKGAL